MRHRRKAKYFGRKSPHRKAMFRNMVTSLFEHGRIRTTVPRAKELRRWADKLITLAKDGSLHARRQALEVIMDKAVVAKLFTDIAEQMSNRNGGYTRIVRIGPRRGDAAMMCYIELVTESIKKEGPAKPKVEEEEAVAPTVIPEAQTESEAKEEKEEVGKEEPTGEVQEEVASEASGEMPQETEEQVTKEEAKGPSEDQEEKEIQDEEVKEEDQEVKEEAQVQEESAPSEEDTRETEDTQKEVQDKAEASSDKKE